MITPYGMEVTFDKTVHIIFPAAIKYIDLGSANIIAGKADGAENVIRVKAAVRNFKSETNFSVITEEGSFYTFNVKYANEPLLMSVEMKDSYSMAIRYRIQTMRWRYTWKNWVTIPHDGTSDYEINLQERPKGINQIGSRKFGIQYLLKRHLYAWRVTVFSYQITNSSNVPFDLDFIIFKIVDKKVMKRTAIQETVIFPIRAFNYSTRIVGKSSERTVFVMDKFTIPDDKEFVVELNEKNGGRHQRFVVENSDIVSAKLISDLKIK